MIFSKRSLVLIYTLIAVLTHEYAHYLIAKNRGYTLARLTLMPYGAILSGDGGLADKDLFAVSVAGPIWNFLFAIIIVAVWWIFPASYTLTLELFRVNVAIGVFNLLPLYPLDGSRIIMSFCKNKSKCLKILRAAGYASSLVCAALFVVSAFFKISYSLALVSVMLFLSASSEAEKEKYVQLCREIYYLKDFSRPIPKKELYIHVSAKVSALLRELKSAYIYTVYVVDGDFKVIKILEGEKLERLFFLDKNRSISDIIAEPDFA